MAATIMGTSEENRKKTLIKGCYLIAEPGCLKPSTGAFHHIYTGYKELNKDFKMIAVLKFSEIELHRGKSVTSSSTNSKINKDSTVKSSLSGAVIDLKRLLHNLLYVSKLVKSLKKHKVQFIYERKAYLNPTGLLAAKILNIPHFYEANGLQFQRMRNDYESFLNPLVRKLEKWTYYQSNHVFFVGTYGNFWNIKKNNWTNIENGIERQHIEFFNEQKKELKRQINICFIARLKKHQRPDILIDALKSLKNKEKVHLFLIGEGLEVIKDAVKSQMHVTNLGFKTRKEIKLTLLKMDIGIIAGSPEYQSAMKIFDYGAAKCAVVAPDITNFKYWFPEEILLFEKENSTSLSKALEDLIQDSEKTKSYGAKLFKKISASFTWEDIYGNVKKIISNKIGQ